MPQQVLVVGGGAAGFFGAIACANSPTSPQVTLLEAGSKPLTKVLISGGGRCNVTHHCFEPSLLVRQYPRGGKALRGAFSRFQPRDTVAWFAKRGVKLKTEADGRMFPVTDNSETIATCLQEAAKEAGVKLLTRKVVKGVKQAEKGFQVELRGGEKLSCHGLLLATGSNPAGYRCAQSLGHSINSPVPSLFTFEIRDQRLTGLGGVSVPEAKISLFPSQKIKNLPPPQIGPLLVTHWGISGPTVLKLSAWGARFLHEQGYEVPLLINWLPQFNREELRQRLGEVKSQQGKKQVSSNCPLPLPKRLWQRLVMAAGITDEKRWAEVSKKQLNFLLTELVAGEYQLQGKGVFKEEFVTCGGVNLKEVNFKTMESKLSPGLHFAGEILDIDGVTGGFNFQSAWTTGWLAGQSLGNG